MPLTATAIRFVLGGLLVERSQQQIRRRRRSHGAFQQTSEPFGKSNLWFRLNKRE
jgi:hypothetical protein